MRHHIVIGLAGALLACAPPAPEDPSVIGEPLQQALDRAESVEQELRQQADSLRRELEDAERGRRRSN